MWTPLEISPKHIGRTLPQVLWKDPGWFFGEWENKEFRGVHASEADELHRKATHIKIPGNDDGQLVAEYTTHPPTGKFGQMRILKKSIPQHVGAAQSCRSDVIDLYLPRGCMEIDAAGYRRLIHNVKHALFGNVSCPMNKNRAEAFFDEEGNFELP